MTKKTFSSSRRQQHSKRSSKDKSRIKYEVICTMQWPDGVVSMSEDFDDMTPDRQTRVIAFAGGQLWEAISNHDLQRFQAYYQFLRDQLQRDMEAYKFHVDNYRERGPISISVGRAALDFGAWQIAEQNFRFTLFRHDDLYRDTVGSPFKQIDGISRVIAASIVDNAHKDFFLLAERYIATFYEVIFQQIPEVFKPPHDVPSFMKANFPQYRQIESLVSKYHSYYEAKVLAGEAPNPPIYGCPLISTGPGSAPVFILP